MKPQISGVCTKVYTMTPKKPNSAIRKVVQVETTIGKVIAAVTGIGHTIQVHNKLLLRPVRRRDLNGVKYAVIRGALDCKGDMTKRKGRSKYGTKKKSIYSLKESGRI